MLQKIRDHSTGWIAGFLLGLIALAFIFWGVDFGFGSVTYAAKVNGEEIPVNLVRRSLQNLMAQYQQSNPDLPPAIEQQLRRSVIDGFVTNELMAQRVDGSGLRISDQALVEQIRSTGAFQVDGQFSEDLYHARLRNEGLNPPYYENQERRAMQVSQLQESIARSAFATPSELRRRLALQREQRELAYVSVPASAFMDEVEIDPARVEQYYEANRARFVKPETLVLEYVELSVEDIAAGIEVDEADLRELYQDELAAGRFETPELRKTRHIMIGIDEERDEAAARVLAESLLERLRAGEDFATLAREYSDDAGSAAEGGELDWLERDALIGDLRDAVFDMEVGELRGPVRGARGLHLVELQDLKADAPPDFESMRASLRTELQQTRAEDFFYEQGQRLGELTFNEAPDTLQPAADELGLDIREIRGVTRSGAGEGLAANREVIATAFSDSVLEKGENSNFVELDDSRVIVLRVAEREPAEQRPLEAVREEILAELRQQDAREAARAEAQALAERLRAGAELAAAAGELLPETVSVQPARLVNRDDATLPAALRSAAFRAPRPEQDGPVVDSVALPGGDHVVFVLSRVVPGDEVAVDTGERRLEQLRLANSSGNAELAAYIAELRRNARIEVREDALQ